MNTQTEQDLEFELDYQQWILSRLSKKPKPASLRSLLSFLLSTAKNFILSLLLFIPKLLIIPSPQFNRHFLNPPSPIHAILSQSSILEFEIPLLVIILPSPNNNNFQQFRKIVENMLTDYEVGQFLNQSFITCGVLEGSKDEKELKGWIDSFEYQIKREGLYFLRNSLFGDLECFGRIGLEFKTEELLKKMAVLRRQHYERDTLEERMVEEIRVKGKGNGMREEMEDWNNA